MTLDQDIETVREPVRWCPEHHMPDCSPLLNGCSRPTQQVEAFNRLLARLREAEEQVQRLAGIAEVSDDGQAERDRYREALEFYADGGSRGYTIMDDAGELARAALYPKETQ